MPPERANGPQNRRGLPERLLGLESRMPDFPPIQITDVSMYDKSRKVTIAHDDRNIHIVKTVARVGCDSVLVWKIDPEGNHEIFMTHYAPDDSAEHLRDLQQHSPRGEGSIRAVYLTFEEENGRMLETQAEIERITGVPPVSIHLPESDIPDTVEEDEKMQDKPELYQMVAIKGIGDDFTVNRIQIPILDGNAYIEEF